MFVVDQLLNPISDAEPCGEDLSFSNDLDAIAQARRFDDPSLDQGEWVTEIKEADWGFVVKNCAKLIESKSKDLRVAVWLAEASAKVNRFRGLGDGYLLLAGLCDKFWVDLYPLQDEDGYEQRIGNLHWLLTRSAQLVREMPVTEGKETGYSIIQFETARSNALAAERQEYPTPIEGLKVAEFDAARRKSSKAFYEKLLADARYCLQALNELESSVDAWLGVDGPGFSAAKDALDNVIRFILPFAHDAGAQTQNAESAEADADEQTTEQASGAQSRTAISGPIQTRTQALVQLRQVADFFRRTEPHSPVAYLADKAAAWGDLPLHDWLRSVVKDPGSLAHIEELLGMNQSGN